MPTPTKQTESESNPMPTWVSIPIILLCLVGGGWLIHWYVISDPLSHEVKVLGDPARAVVNPGSGNWGGNGGRNGGGNGAGNGAGNGGGKGGGNPLSTWFGGGNKKPGNRTPRFIPLDDQKDRWEVRTDLAEVIAFNQNGAFNIRLLYNNSKAILPPDVYQTLTATAQLLKDKHGDALKLSTEQVRRLHGLSNNISDMVMTPADKKSLEDQVAKGIHATDADRPALEPAIYQAVDQVAKASIPATVQAATEHAAEINKIITPDLWRLNAALYTLTNPPK